MSPEAKTSINAKLYNTKGINIKLPAEVWLTEKEVKAQNGYAMVPIKFLGEKVSYELSNGQKGEIELRIPNCNSCPIQIGGKNTLKIPVTESLTLRFKSARNGCGEGKVYGETRIIVENDKPMLTIDESKVPERVCSGTEIEVFFKKTGKWGGSEKIFLKTDSEYLTNERVLTNEEISTGKVIYKITPQWTYDVITGNFWIESDNATSNSVKIIVDQKPSFSNLLLSGSNSTVYDANGNEVKYLMQSSSPYNLEWYSNSGASSFVIDGKSVSPNRTYHLASSYSQSIYIKKDTSFILNSVSNSCGTTVLNKKFLIKPVASFIKTTSPILGNYYYCEGSKATITINYVGVVPDSDNFVLELVKSNSREILHKDFFSIPIKKNGKNLEFTIPENLSGYHYFRVKSTVLNIYSEAQSLGYINKKTQVSLVSESGQSEVLGTPGANLYLKPKSNEFSKFWIKLNNGEFYSNYDFNFYPTYGNDGEKLENRGKYFTPSETTTFSIQSVYDACGVGVADGTVKIVITPKVQLSLNNQKYNNAFCSGEEIDLNLTYYGGFPVDTLMGAYLHSFDNPDYNFELSTFKNKQGKLKIKLPSDLNTGNYFIQVRKKSRANIFSILTGGLLSEKEKNQQFLNLDSEPLYISLLSPPVVKLTGNTEIFEGNEALLNIEVLTQNGLDKIEDKPIAYYELTLSNGVNYTSTDFSWYVSPKKSETYTITSVKNACGTGKGTGSATITVYPKTENRVETKGFLRSDGFHESYYDYFNEFCANHSDSLDVEIYGKSSSLDLGKLSIQLSEGEGAKYRTIPVSKYLEVLPKYYSEGTEFRLIRLWFQFPSDVQKGDNYRIKAVVGNSDIPSTPLQHKVKISELPTANLSGELMVVEGQNAIATVNFTGKSPWYVSITDENEQIVYNNIPKAISAESEPTSTDLILKNNFPVEFSMTKSNIFKVSEVYNNLCGEGKPGEGTLRVSLVLSNELQSKIQVQIYPNPTQDLLYFDFKNVENKALIKVFDQSGRQVYNKEYLDNKTKQRQTLSLEKLPQGIYLLNVSSGNFSQTYRVFKN